MIGRRTPCCGSADARLFFPVFLGSGEATLSLNSASCRSRFRASWPTLLRNVTSHRNEQRCQRVESPAAVNPGVRHAPDPLCIRFVPEFGAGLTCYGRGVAGAARLGRRTIPTVADKEVLLTASSPRIQPAMLTLCPILETPPVSLAGTPRSSVTRVLRPASHVCGAQS